MPEVPSNMQEELNNLEIAARDNPQNRISTSSTVSSMHSSYLDQRNPGLNASRQNGPGFTASYEHTNASAYQNIRRSYQEGQQQFIPDSPLFSPFPKLRNPAPNVPLSDEEKEEVLERARSLVLKSTDPEMQLAWAQDALSWVEVASQNAIRNLPDGQSSRSATPKVEHELKRDALNIVQFLADQHHPKAEFMKGMWLEFGKFGYRVDKKEAFLGYKRAAEKGYARAEYRIGMQYENSNDPGKAIDHYKRGVAMKDSASNYRLGMMTLLGQHGMRQDYQRGVDLIRFAADTADENAPQGSYVYGMLLARELPNISIPEQFLPFDLNDAKLFIEKAAYLGFAKAQLKMAQAYELCQLGCEFDPALSLHYNALAARQGEAEADMAISKWFLCGYEDVFEKNEELAFTYAQRAAMTKMPTAEFAMGYFYEIGVYVQPDLAESEKWYKKASEHGNKDALGRIDSIRKNNTFSKKDHEQVAINRIKSMHGSMRGVRPDRFKNKVAPMASIPDDRVDMPELRNSYSGGNGVTPLRLQKGPARPTSAAPYPEDDLAFNSYNQGLRPNSSSGPQADRPSSAFGIRPLHHSTTEVYDQGLRPVEPQRPYSSLGNTSIPPAGRGGSGPQDRNRVSSGGWEPQVPNQYRAPSPGGPPVLPPINSGPPANFGGGGPTRLQKQPPNLGKPQPSQPMPTSGYGNDSYTRQSAQSGYDAPLPIPRREPAANSFVRPERLSSIQPGSGVGSPTIQSPQQRIGEFQSMQNPGRTSQRPPQTTMSSQQGPRPVSAAQQSLTSPGPKGSGPSGGPQRPVSAAPSQASSAASSGPKRQGPATFEEMGIPAGKNESDCILM
jgi:TPR repeat protein